jgi:hypothetical protein
MAIITFDINAEIDRVWHLDVDQVDLLIRSGPYAKHVVESFNLDPATYELVADSDGRYLKVTNDAVGVVTLSFRVQKVGTTQAASMTIGVPVAGQTGQETLTFLKALGLLGTPDYVFGGVTVTPRTVAKDAAGNLWRHTGHYTASGEPYFRSTQNLSDQGLTISNLNSTRGPLSVFK